MQTVRYVATPGICLLLLVHPIPAEYWLSVQEHVDARSRLVHVNKEHFHGLYIPLVKTDRNPEARNAPLGTALVAASGIIAWRSMSEAIRRPSVAIRCKRAGGNIPCIRLLAITKSLSPVIKAVFACVRHEPSTAIGPTGVA